MARYLVYDVFTDRPFGGNPLAVFPDGEAVPAGLRQAVAREFNLSETVFLLPAAAADETAQVQIFTPTSELPFAGHPTIGAALALAEAGLGPEMVLRLGIGPVAVRAAGGRAEFTVARPFEVLSHPGPALVARCLGLPAEAVRGRPVHGGVGLDVVLVELTDSAALAAAAPVTDAFRTGARAHPGGLGFAIYAYCREGREVQARMFAPLDLIPEDPATGSAAAALGAHLGESVLMIRQGEAMGRPSRIEVRTGAKCVTVAGRAVRVMEGDLLSGALASVGAPG